MTTSDTSSTSPSSTSTCKNVELTATRKDTSSTRLNAHRANLISPTLVPQTSNSTPATESSHQEQQGSGYYLSASAERKNKHPALSCISLPLFSFEEYNYKVNQSSLLSTTSNTNLANLNDASLLYADHSLAKSGGQFQAGESINSAEVAEKTAQLQQPPHLQQLQRDQEEADDKATLAKECALNTQIANFINSLELNESQQVI